MNPLDPVTLARMQAAAEASMFDTCVIQEPVEIGEDMYNYPINDQQDVEATVCGFDTTSGNEVQGSNEVIVEDAQVRLPLSLDGTVTNRQVIKLTHRHGVALPSPLYYQIIGDVARGPTALVVSVKRVTDRSSE